MIVVNSTFFYDNVCVGEIKRSCAKNNYRDRNLQIDNLRISKLPLSRWRVRRAILQLNKGQPIIS